MEAKSLILNEEKYSRDFLKLNSAEQILQLNSCL